MSNNSKRPRNEVQNQNDRKKIKVSDTAKELEVVINNNNTNSNTIAHMERKFEYSISSGFAWQPCQKPFESVCKDGVKLGFNYWMNNDKILDADATELIISLLFGRPSPPFMGNNSTESLDTIVVAIVTGVGPIHLAKEISQLNFLSRCSCLPVRHSALDGYQWKPFDTEFMPSLLLWPLKSPMSLNLVHKIGLHNLFKNCHILFDADCNHWYDQISFQCDMNVMDSVNNYIDTKKEIDPKSTLPSIKFRDGDIIGRFKRRTNGDKGYFLLRKRNKSPSCILYLLWQKHFPDILYDDIANESTDSTILPPPRFMSQASRNSGNDPEEALGIIFSPFRMTLYSAVCINEAENERDAITSTSYNVEDNGEIALEDNEVIRSKIPDVTVQEYCDNDDSNRISAPAAMNFEINSTTEITLSVAINNNGGSSLTIDEESVKESIDLTTSDSKETFASNRTTTTTAKTTATKTATPSESNCIRSLIDTYRRSLASTNIESDLIDASAHPLTQTQSLPDVNEALREESLIRLKTDFQDLLASPKGLLELESMVLSKNMLELFGYPMDTDTTLSGFKCTHSLHWRPPANAIIPREVEEGEESEGDDAEGGGGDGGDETLQICALDCEMVTTERGLELARLTVVSADRGVVLDMMVKPESPVIDYNTAYSGITEALLRPVTNKFQDALQKLRKFLSRSTIIIGHSLDCDLRTLRLIHYRVIDTAALYPHPRGAPFKHGLKKLALDILGQSVQTSSGTNGHDSIQDAMVAFELVLLKAKRGESYGLPPPWPPVDGQERTSRVSIRERIIEEESNRRESAPPSDRASCVDAGRRCYVHSCGPLVSRPIWERHAFGYKSEGNACIAFSNNSSCSDNNNNMNLPLINENPLSPLLPPSIQQETEPKSLCEFHCKEHKCAQSALEHALVDLQHERGPPALFWLDMPVDLTHHSYANLAGTSSTSAGATWSSLTDVDESLTRVYASMSRGSVLLVLTQGDLAEVRKLVVKRQRYWWESAPTYRKVVGCAPVTWTPEDEEQLIKASAHVLAGALFLKIKP